tara:strand:- start:344 stop:556 length:213 start_codon:yes stop_codon:yes gene_type:complete
MNTPLEHTQYPIEDDGSFTNLKPLIEELEAFIGQYSTHAMSDYVLFLQGKLEGYKDTVKYLKAMSPYDYE